MLCDFIHYTASLFVNLSHYCLGFSISRAHVSSATNNFLLDSKH